MHRLGRQAAQSIAPAANLPAELLKLSSFVCFVNSGALFVQSMSHRGVCMPVFIRPKHGLQVAAVHRLGRQAAQFIAMAADPLAALPQLCECLLVSQISILSGCSWTLLFQAACI